MPPPLGACYRVESGSVENRKAAKALLPVEAPSQGRKQSLAALSSPSTATGVILHEWMLSASIFWYGRKNLGTFSAPPLDHVHGSCAW